MKGVEHRTACAEFMVVTDVLIKASLGIDIFGRLNMQGLDCMCRSAFPALPKHQVLGLPLGLLLEEGRWAVAAAAVRAKEGKTIM